VRRRDNEWLAVTASDRLETLADAIRRVGWPSALPEFLAAFPAERAERFRWSLARRHTAWQGFLPEGRRDHVAVIDFGLGTTVLALARSFARVDALYVDPALRDIAEARARFAGVRNIEFRVVTELPSAPIPKASCDAVCACELPAEYFTAELTGAMGEWVAPGGGMFLSTLRPRFTDAWTYLRAHARLRTLFDERRYFRYMGHPTRASEIAPMRMLAGAFRQRAASILAPIHAPALAIVGADRTAAQATFEAVKAQVESRLGSGALTVLRYRFSHPAGFTFEVRDSAGQRLFIRMPLDQFADMRTARNFCHLHALRSLERSTGTFFPTPMDSGTVAGQPYYVESAVSGRPFTGQDGEGPEQNAGALPVALEWIGAFHERTAVRRVIDAEEFERLVALPTRTAAEHLAPPDARQLHESLLPVLRARLVGRTLPLVFAHGDYTFDNLLFDESQLRVQAVFDWDLGDEAGLPLLDPLYCILTARRSAEGASTLTATARILAELLRGKFTAREIESLDAYRRRFDLSECDITTFTLLMWIHHLGVRMREPERHCVAREDWRPVLDTFPHLLSGAKSGLV
jgi:hypothetical protein